MHGSLILQEDKGFDGLDGASGGVFGHLADGKKVTGLGFDALLKSLPWKKL